MAEEPADRGENTRPRPKGPVHCRRLDRLLPVAEHDVCPYCFGEVADIQTGDHGVFCDFRPGEDPISFGFPETHGRYRWPDVPAKGEEGD